MVARLSHKWRAGLRLHAIASHTYAVEGMEPKAGAPFVLVGRARCGRRDGQVLDEFLAGLRLHAFDRVSMRGDVERLSPVDRIGPHHAPAYRRQRRHLFRTGETLGDLAARMTVAVPGERV